MILDDTETVATFMVEGDAELYEIDHLGITDPTQWGQYTVYRRRRQVAAFAVPVSVVRSRSRASRPPASDEELVELARAALTADDH